MEVPRNREGEFVTDLFERYKRLTGFGELPGAEWQRCVVHFERNVLSQIPANETRKMAEDLKAISKVRREKTARTLAEEFVSLYGGRFPEAVSVFETGIGDALSYLGYPGSHHARIRTTNMLESLFREVKRRSRMVGVFPNETSATTLATEIALRSRRSDATSRWTLSKQQRNQTHNFREIDTVTPCNPHRSRRIKRRMKGIAR